jgi:hypothetical protein
MSHRHPADVACTEIGSGVCIRPVVHGDGLGKLWGYIVAHERVGGWDPAKNGFERCEGSVRVRQTPETPHPCWEQTGNLDTGDLTLSPSVLCTNIGGCGGSHGFVRAGQWVPA